jgi:hypothetical protein
MKRIGLAAILLFTFATLAVKAQAPETPFTFNPPSASCGGGFTCFMGQYVGSAYMHGMFNVNGSMTIYITPTPGAPTITISGGVVTTTQTLTNPGGYPAVYHVTTTISDATKFVNGEAVDTVATATLEYDWQRIGHSVRGGGWWLSFPGGIKLTGLY